jgi:hypothetical protein
MHSKGLRVTALSQRMEVSGPFMQPIDYYQIDLFRAKNPE